MNPILLGRRTSYGAASLGNSFPRVEHEPKRCSLHATVGPILVKWWAHASTNHRLRDATTGQMPRKLSTTLLFYTQDLDGSCTLHILHMTVTIRSQLLTPSFQLHPSTRIKMPQMDATPTKRDVTRAYGVARCRRPVGGVFVQRGLSKSLSVVSTFVKTSRRSFHRTAFLRERAGTRPGSRVHSHSEHGQIQRPRR